MTPSWAVTAVAAALSAVLSSGVTTVFLRLRAPETVAISPPVELTVEQRALVELLVDPGARFVPANVGTAVPASESLRSLGYVRGWTRTFSAERQQLDAFVLEFASESGARGYARGIGGAARLLSRPEPFALPVPNASGLVDAVRADDGRYLHLVALYRGARAALLVFRDESRSGADLLALAQRQYDALA
ncbi:MAG TPA: hypothetical protein VGX28_07685 [Frankiaceae bacterium]|jgi:hypothetical protein|nr:hypothetical protein [Frankiaceae bacterium]